MSAGSSASNLGYGNITPFNNVNGNFVNKYSSNNPANFGSNEIPGLPGLAGAKNNVNAAAGIVPGICFTGGAKRFKRKIKNITKRYKMGKMKLSKKLKSLRKNLRSRMASASASLAGGKKELLKSLKSNMRSRMASASASLAGGRTRRNGRRTRKNRQRGGYAQYQNNQPFYNTYSVGGVLSANESALANPPPINKVTNNAIDNYNHYTNKGFPSRGH
jgi:hypothetical protein